MSATAGAETRYVRYTRLSKGRAGIARQKSVTDAYITRHGGRIVAEFTDHDTTAWAVDGDAPRPGFDEMLRYVVAHPGVHIIAWHADRLARGGRDAQAIVATCRAGNHLVVTPSGGTYDLTTATGRKRWRDDITAADFEVDHLRERTQAAMDEIRASGRWMGNARPFGWRRDASAPGGLVLDEAEADVLSLAARDVVAGHPMYAIARRWNEQGILTAGGRPWSGSALRRVLLRPTNYAPAPAAWPAIITEAEHRAVTAVLTSPGRRTTPGPAPVHLMTGIMRCGAKGCGAAVIVRGRAHGGQCYRCSTVSTPGAAGTGHVTRDRAHVDAYVAEVVIARLERPDVAGMFARRDDGRLPELYRSRDALTALMAESHAMRMNGTLTTAEFATERTAHLGQAAELDRDIASRLAVSVIASAARDPRATWEAADIVQRRAIVRELATWTLMPLARRGRGFDPGGIVVGWL